MCGTIYVIYMENKMKLTANYLKRLIRESLAQMDEGDVIQGNFGGGSGGDEPPEDREPASVTDISSRKKSPESDESEDVVMSKELVTAVASLVDTILDIDNLDKIAEADEGLAEKLHEKANSLLVFVRSYIPSEPSDDTGTGYDDVRSGTESEPQPEDFGEVEDDD